MTPLTFEIHLHSTILSTFATTRFVAGLQVGNLGACFGGVIVWIGGGVIGASTANGQFGAGKNSKQASVCEYTRVPKNNCISHSLTAPQNMYKNTQTGQNMFVGGGVIVQVGFQDISSHLTLIRAGFGQFAVGGGVLTMTGEVEIRSWGVGFVANAGQTYSVGGGILQFFTGVIANAQISVMQAVAGGGTYCGSGDLAFINMDYNTLGVTFAQYGVGMRWFNGAGA